MKWLKDTINFSHWNEFNILAFVIVALPVGIGLLIFLVGTK